MSFKTKNGWTKKKMISYIEKHFKGQSIVFKSAHSNIGVCLYRGPQGKKCAVGLFIPDEVYEEGMEGQNVKSLTLEYTIVEHMPISMDGMEKLQWVHDNDNLEVKKSIALANMIDWIEKNVEDSK